MAETVQLPDEAKYPLALRSGTVLTCGNERVRHTYRTVRVLGQGGFGITYQAQDCATGAMVAIKEYMPHEFARRSGSGNTLVPISQEKAGYFQYGKQKFIEEAKTLSQFAGNRYIVNIMEYFEANGTAYFVMEYVVGQQLQKIIKRTGPLPQNSADSVILPLANALSAVHAHGVVHRDIAPDNIMIMPDGTPKLIDFGAARYSTGKKSCSLDVILKDGFAPLEQYKRHGKQGPFTDVYALAATYYYAVTGRIPPDSIERMQEDELCPPLSLGAKISPNTEKALLKALNIQPEDRFSSMEEFRNALIAAGTSFRTSGEFAERPEVSPDPVVSSSRIPNSGPATTRINRTQGISMLLQRAFLALADGNWDEAKSACGKVLVWDQQNAQAYLGMLMADLKAKTSEELKELQTPLDSSQHYSTVLQLADDSLRQKLEEYNAEIRKRTEPKQAEPKKIKKKQIVGMLSAVLVLLIVCTAALGSRKNEPAAEVRRSGSGITQPEPADHRGEDYDDAMELKRSGKYEEAMAVFEVLGKYRDSVNQAADCRERLIAELISDADDAYSGKDYDPAAQLYRKAADYGNAEAQNSLGDCYYFGRGVIKDYAEAVRWYRKSANQSYAPGQDNLGIMYEGGHGIAQDYTEALKWYRKAADQEYADAQYNIGCMYRTGRGVQKDLAEAKRWLQKAADQGHYLAMATLLLIP